MLAAGTAAQAAFAATGIGLPVLVPVLREEYGLSLGEIGVLLSAEWVGALVTLLPWGLATDRYGERVVLALGLVGGAACLAGSAFAPNFATLLVLLGGFGGAGASVISASGRAVMHWFPADERGLALGIRQTAVPLGGLVAALTLPPIASGGGAESAFLFLAALCAVGAVAGAVVLRGREAGEGIEPASVARTLRDGRLWRLCLGSSIFVYSQFAITGFGVLFLHDEHGFSERDAALVIAAAQVVGAGFRIGAGRWSDVLGGRRVVPLRRVGLVIAATLAVTAALAGGPLWLLVPVLTLAGGLSMAWNGLAFTAAAELGGAQRSGAAIGVQQSVLSAYGVVAPVLFAASIAAFSWTVAFALASLFPLAGWVALRPLRGY